jgi:AcrR family transcriptional regulator
MIRPIVTHRGRDVHATSAGSPRKLPAGRPPATPHTDAARRIYTAAQTIVEQKGHFAIKDREIANAAGVSVAMINYYFESKEGLLFALVDEFCAGLASALEEVERRARSTASDAPRPTRALMRILVHAYHAHPAISHIVMAEIARNNSIVRLGFMKRYKSRAMESLKRMFDHLLHSGVYDRQMDTSHAALALLSLLNGPLLITAALRPAGCVVGPGVDALETERWIDYIADLFDRQFIQADERE